MEPLIKNRNQSFKYLQTITKWIILFYQMFVSKQT